MRDTLRRLALPFCLLAATGALGADTTEYRFRVLLDDAPIGRHLFRFGSLLPAIGRST